MMDLEGKQFGSAITFGVLIDDPAYSDWPRFFSTR